MRFHWPKDTLFRREVLDVEQDACSLCGQALHICDHRFHRIFTLNGPVELICRLAHCSDPACPARDEGDLPAELIARHAANSKAIPAERPGASAV